MGADVESSAEQKAFAILKEAGAKFESDSATDRAIACEKYLQTVLLNADVFVEARVMKEVEAIVRSVTSVQTMIGAPKKRTEGREVEPMEAVRRWINGEPIESIGIVKDEADAEI